MALGIVGHALVAASHCCLFQQLATEGLDVRYVVAKVFSDLISSSLSAAFRPVLLRRRFLNKYASCGYCDSFRLQRRSGMSHSNSPIIMHVFFSPKT